MLKKRFRETASPAVDYPRLGHDRRRFLSLLGGSLASAIGLGARGGCMPVRPAPLDLQAPDAGHDGRPADSKALPGDQSAADG
jgi:hypothetical protein